MTKPKDTLNRREFLGGIAAASTVAILPRHVLGGPGHIPPSDKIVLAQIGCGTQALRQVDCGLLTREELHFSCVCDPNTDSTNYRDWSPHGIRDSVREVLHDPTWGENDEGVRAGREVAREIIETYYGKAKRSGNYEGVRTYADFRELLEKETDIDGIVSITPDHQHAVIAITAMEKGKAAISHKPVSNVLYEARRAVETARERGVVSHLLAYSDHPDYHTLEKWIKAGVIGPIREVHNWTNRPVWPQGWLDYPTERPPVPEGFDWELWQGPVPERPYHPNYTFTLYRGWFDYGSGCLGDMGNYSLWQPYRIMDLGTPVSVEAHSNHECFVNEDNVCQTVRSEVAFPSAGSVQFRHAARGERPPVDVIWYSGTLPPPTPDELIESGEEMPSEGMLFVGDDGKILCDFRGENPRLIPVSRMRVFGGPEEPENEGRTDEDEEDEDDDEWINAIKNGGTSRGSFENVAPLAEATCLACIALRFPGRRLEWDAERMEFTNAPEANQFVRRNYRPGWEV